MLPSYRLLFNKSRFLVSNMQLSRRALGYYPAFYFGSMANPSKGGPETYDLVKKKVDKLMK